MDALELKEALDTIGWTGPELARRIGASKQFVNQMTRGKRAVPELVGVYVKAVARAVSRVRDYPKNVDG